MSYLADGGLRDDAVSGDWDGTHLDLAYTTNLLNQSAEHVDVSAEAAPADADPSTSWFTSMCAQLQAPTNGANVYYPDEPDEPYTW